MSNLVKYAESELKLLGMSPKGPKNSPNTWVAQNVMKIVKEFSKGGHSGHSAGYTIGVLERVLKFEPLSPLTGEDSEWVEVGNGVFQNNRCPHVFKEKGRAYDLDGKIFREPDGSCYTNGKSRVFITFPYVPKREYVDVPAP